MQQESSRVGTDTDVLSICSSVKVQSCPSVPMKSRIQPTVPSPPQARTLKFGTSLKKFSLQNADSKDCYCCILFFFLNGFINCIWKIKWKASCFLGFFLWLLVHEKNPQMLGWVLTSFSCSSLFTGDLHNWGNIFRSCFLSSKTELLILKKYLFKGCCCCYCYCYSKISPNISWDKIINFTHWIN